jgi:hypothetical protein
MGGVKFRPLQDRSLGSEPSSPASRWQKIETTGDSRAHLYLEVIDRGGREDVGLLERIPFQQITDLLGDVADHLGSTLLRARPSKASIELGVEFGLENGQLVALIARGSGKANLKIAMEWEQSAPGSADG